METNQPKRFPPPTSEELEQFKQAYRNQYNQEPPEYEVNWYKAAREHFGTEEERLREVSTRQELKDSV